jgi:integrase
LATNWQPENIMAKITDKQMTAKPTTSDKWFSEVALWGHGSLAARITPSGERLFYFRYLNSQGVRVTLPIGSYSRSGNEGTMSLADASLKAQLLAGLHKSGIKDIREHLAAEEAVKVALRDAEIARLAREKSEIEKEQNRLNARMTVRDLFERWVALEIANRKDGGVEVRRMFEKDVLPNIGDLYVEDINKRQITEITDVLLARGVKRMAKVIFALIRQMFNFAVERDFIQVNPTAAINKGKVFGKDEERDRVLSEDELRLLKIQLPKAALITSTEIAVWIALSTCCRIGELLSAEWKHIDYNKKTWIIPSENSKNGRALTIFLSNFAIHQFELLKQVNGQSLWCYPNRDDSSSVSPKTVTKQLSDRQRDAKGAINGRSQQISALVLPGGGWTPHDLRRTGASMMTKLRVLPEVADRCLNHTEDNKVKRTYQRYDYASEMGEAWTLLGEHLTSILNPIT